MQPSCASLLSALHWRANGELSDEDLALIVPALGKVSDESCLDLNRLLQRSVIPSGC